MKTVSNDFDRAGAIIFEVLRAQIFWISYPVTRWDFYAHFAQRRAQPVCFFSNDGHFAVAHLAVQEESVEAY